MYNLLCASACDNAAGWQVHLHHADCAKFSFLSIVIKS